MQLLCHDFSVAGAVAGALAIGSTQPLDIVRIRLQQSQGPATGVIRGSSRGAGSRVGPGQSTVWSTLRKIVRTEGVLSLYKGMAFPLTFASLQSAILFQVCDQLNKMSTAGYLCKSRHCSSGRVVQFIYHMVDG
jgi:solute carrier family 25 carnitine/acylcarnitine transporter 20/29